MPGRALASVALAAVLSGCASSSVTLDARPTDLSSARALARSVADTARCDSFEDYSQHSDYWTFTCQTGEHTYDIRTVSGTGARQSALKALADVAPVKAGDFFLVTEATGPGRSNVAVDLAAFPGELQPTP